MYHVMSQCLKYVYLQYLIQDSYILPVKNAPKASSTSLVNENRFLLGRIVYKYLERFFVQLIYINNHQIDFKF